MSNKWVAETVKAFITDAVGIDPTDPVATIEQYFDKTATEELKASCMEAGKTAAKCWKFIEAVARESLRGKSGHIDSNVVLAIAMHYFQDVPVDWKGTPPVQKAEEAGEEAKEDRSDIPKAAKKPKPAKKSQQGFFFDVLEATYGKDADNAG